MPSTIVKLCSSDARAWAHNQPVWLAEDGEVSRPVTRAEQQAISRALERTRTMQQSFRMELPLLDVADPRRRHASDPRAQRPSIDPRRLQHLGSNKRAPITKLDCAFEVEFFGNKRVVTVFTGKLRYATGREVLAARLLADHGECVLHGRNGKCIGVLRDPLIDERPPREGRRVQYSRNPDEEKLRAARTAELARTVSPMQRGTGRAAVNGRIYSPDQCPNDCRGYRGGGAWALAKDAVPPSDREHHPVCKFAASWAATLEPEEARSVQVLYDLERSLVTRQAEPPEIAEADEVERRTSIRQITVQDRLYAVLPEEEAIQAAREARGEAEGDGSDGALEAERDELDTERPSAPPGHRPATPAPALEAGAGVSQPAERDHWPRFDEIEPEVRKQRAEITARDYLSRAAPADAPLVGPSS